MGSLVEHWRVLNRALSLKLVSLNEGVVDDSDLLHNIGRNTNRGNSQVVVFIGGPLAVGVLPTTGCCLERETSASPLVATISFCTDVVVGRPVVVVFFPVVVAAVVRAPPAPAAAPAAPFRVERTEVTASPSALVPTETISVFPS